MRTRTLLCLSMAVFVAAAVPALSAEINLNLTVVDASGTKLSAYTLRAFHVSGEVPEGAKLDANGLVGFQNEVGAGGDRISGLFPGKWVLAASVRGKHAAAWRVVDIAEGENTVSLALERPETLWIELKDIAGSPRFSNAILIHDACPVTEHVREKWLEGKWSRQGLQPPGVFAAPLGREEAYPTEDLPPGRYTLLASSGGTLIWTTGIEVKSGGENRVAVRPAVRTLTVKVTDSGKPKAGVNLYLTAPELKEPMMAKSGESGLAHFRGTIPGTADVFTEREYAFSRAGGAAVRGRRVQWQSSLDANLEIELFDPHTVWLTIVVDDRKNLVDQNCFLSRREPDVLWRPACKAHDANRTRFEFGPVPLGDYTFSGGLKPPKQNDGGGEFRVAIQLDKSGEQTVTVKLGLFAVAGKIAAPKGAILAQAEIHLISQDSDYVADWRRECRKVRVNDKGAFEAADLPLGRYLVTAVMNDGADNCFMVSQLVNVTKDVRNLKLTLTDEVGRIQVDVTRPPLDKVPLNAGAPSNARLRVFDASGAELLLPVSDRLSNNANKLLTFYSIPCGTYRVRLEQKGALPAERDNVVVQKGRATSVELTLQPAHACAIALNGVAEQDVWALGASVALLTSDGAALALDREYLAPAIRWTKLGGTLTLWSVPPEAVSVRVSIPGFQTVTATLKKADTTTVLVTEVEIKKE